MERMEASLIGSHLSDKNPAVEKGEVLLRSAGLSF
jgi:hypothetical protein